MEAMGAPLLSVDDHHRELVARLRGLLEDELLGVYASGSFALGGFDHYLSDVDVAAVGATPVDQTTKQAIVEALRHESLPCPARGLEFVLYPEPVLRTTTTDPGFDLNLNSGARMRFRVDYEPSEERHWFAIDRSMRLTQRPSMGRQRASSSLRFRLASFSKESQNRSGGIGALKPRAATRS
jgi:hypothetical protein